MTTPANEPTVNNLLDVSTIHVHPSRDFGDHRVAEHEYGWILFVSDIVENEPDWLKPIIAAARERDAHFINFDADADSVEGWEEYE